MLKRGSVIFFIPVIIGVIFALAGIIWWKVMITAPSNNEETVRVVIDKGTSAENIGKRLADAGAIKSAFAFKLQAQLTDQTKGIPPGEFFVPQNLSLAEVIEFLKKGPKEYWVTIPEGLRREEYPQIFIDAFGLEGESATTFKSEFLAESKNYEGYLFPDSYLFPPDVEASVIVSRLVDTFYKKVGENYEQRAQINGLTVDQAVSLASLIERETITDQERPVVAGIAYNRLKVDMPLQMDASVQYVLGSKRCRANNGDCDWWNPPLKADLEIASTYNTYTNAGIPSEPIANPGISSLMAVINPESSDYYYYIHADGQIYYAKTLDQHNANVAKYLR